MPTLVDPSDPARYASGFALIALRRDTVEVRRTLKRLAEHPRDTEATDQLRGYLNEAPDV